MNLKSSNSTCCLTACPSGLSDKWEFVGVIKHFCLSVENALVQNDFIIKANVICMKLLRVSTRSGQQQAYKTCLGRLVVYFVYKLCKPDDDPPRVETVKTKKMKVHVCAVMSSVSWAGRSGVKISKTFRPASGPVRPPVYWVPGLFPSGQAAWV